MSRTSFDVTLDLTVEVCWVCGITWAMDSRWATKRSERGLNFFCPAGCRLRYGESENDKLKKDLKREKDKLERERQWHKRTEEAKERLDRRLSATKGVVTRMRNRAAEGVCPCCKRSFPELQKHMRSKHPDYAHLDPEAE